MKPQSASRNPQSVIRLLLVDDSPVVLTILKRMLASSSEIQVVGTAQNGQEALELIPQLQPTVICTDLQMPKMDGLEFTKEVMVKYPRPILVISAYVQEEDTQNVFQLLEAGAIDVFAKPRGGLETDYQRLTQELISRIKILSGVVVFRKPEKKTFIPSLPAAIQLEKTTSAPGRSGHIRIVAIGASTGGPQALQEILTKLPSDFPAPVICIQHISEGFLQGLVAWLTSQCMMKVKVAQSGEFPWPGMVYFPQEGTHLKIDNEGRLVSSFEPPFEGHRPSVTVSLKSIAKYYGSAAVGVLLTGMGRDGADGMRQLADAGGMTIAQNEESCVVFGMPKQAIDLKAARYILPLSEIAEILITKVFPEKRIKS